MKDFLSNLKTVQSKVNVSIILNTHRTRPDNQQDRIVLKNLIKEAEERLYKDYDKAIASKIIEKLHHCAEKIDHEHNQEALVIYVNESYAEYHRISIPVINRVVIDPRFATRDIIRSKTLETKFHSLVLSKHIAKLYTVSSSHEIEELNGEFPILNHLVPADPLMQSTNKGQDNLVEEFFNTVDKKVNKTIPNPKESILLLTDSRNFDHYSKVADHKNKIAGYISGNFENSTIHQILSQSWEFMSAKNQGNLQLRMEDLDKAQKSGKVISDISEIWRSIKEGKGQTLFVNKDLQYSAIIHGDQIQSVENGISDEKFATDDVVDEMIENCILHSGEVVFVSDDSLSDYQGLALSLRY